MKQNKYENLEIWRIIDILNWGSSFLKEKGLDSSRLKIELLLCHVLKNKRIHLYSNFEQPLTKDELAEIKTLIKRCLAHEPVQFIIGKSQFLDFELNVNNTSIVPRPETEQMASIIITENKDIPELLEILDIGSGTGCLAIALDKYLQNPKIDAVDISAEALSLSKENAELNNTGFINFFNLDILNNLPEIKYDIVVSNPPYVDLTEYNKLEPEVRLFEPMNAITDNSDGLTFYRRFSEILPDILKPNGKFYFEIGYGQKKDLEKIFSSKHFEFEFINDFSNIPRILKGKLI